MVMVSVTTTIKTILMETHTERSMQYVLGLLADQPGQMDDLRFDAGYRPHRREVVYTRQEGVVVLHNVQARTCCRNNITARDTLRSQFTFPDVS